MTEILTQLGQNQVHSEYKVQKKKKKKASGKFDAGGGQDPPEPRQRKDRGKEGAMVR